MTCINCPCALCLKAREDSLIGLTAEEYSLLQQKKVIGAIKAVRTRLGLNLRDAKNLVDKFR